ncbi:AAA family ATPase [Archaeoglobus sp. JdFR-39]|uniref:AAA family ATPase n=1 Tax=Archaeoglobus sp. JdFR-39 TaxID=1934996 RepID=UPI0032E3C13F
MIKRVKLTNFISHANTEVEFPLGVTVLVGPNGAGKTSIIDAIVYALFGKRTRGERFEDLIRSGANSAEVELTFEADGKEYAVHCVRRKRGSEATLYRSDIGPIATTPNEVLQEISKILGMDKDTAMNSIFIRQGEITSLIDADPRERKNLIGRLIGLDKLEKAWQNMHDVIQHFEEKAKDYKVVKRELELAEEERRKIARKMQELNEEIKKLGEELRRAKENLKKAEDELNDWRRKKEKYHELNERLAAAEKEIESKKREIERLKQELSDAERAREEMEKLEPEIRKIPLLKKYVDTLNEKEKCGAERSRLTDELDRVLAYKREIDETRAAYEEYTESEKRVEEIKKTIEGLQHVEKRRAEIEATVRSLSREIEEAKSELDRLESKALDILPEATIEAKEALLKKLSKEKAEIEGRKSELDGEEGRIKGRIKEIDECLSLLGESNVCPVCKSKLTPEHREKVRRDFEEERRELTEKLQLVKKELEELNSKKKQVEEEISRVSEINVERIDELRKNLKIKTIEKEKLQNELESLQSELNKLEELRKNLNELQSRLRELREDYEKFIAAQKALEKERKEEEIRSELLKIEEVIKSLDSSLDELTRELGYVPEDPRADLDKLEGLREKYEGCKFKADTINEIRENIEKAEQDLRELLTIKEDVLREIEQLQYSDERYMEVEKKFYEASSVVTGIRTKLDDKIGQRKEKEEELRSIEEKIEELKEKLKELEKVMEFVSDLERIRKAFSRDGVQKLLRQKIAPMISEYARNYVERFNLDITDISVDEDFDISIIKEGGEISIKSISGGEKVAVAIALRLAIAKALAGRISTIIMDEPTTHLDEERRRELVEIMKSFFGEGAAVPQMIIVTHHRELEEVAQTVYEVEKIDGVSRVRLVESFGAE